MRKTNSNTKKSSTTFLQRNENLSWFLAGAVCGSILTFIFDPVRGNYRQALIRDKGVSLKRNSRLYGGKLLRDLKNRTQGLKARTNKVMSQREPVNDEVLEARIRSEFGRIISHPKAVKVSAQDSVVTLSGLILEDEVNKLIKRVKKVAGVREVIDELEVHSADTKIPSLQGKGPDYLHS